MTASGAGCNIVLIGFTATGKTHVAPLVAAALGWDVFDTDAEVTRRTGRPISQIFEQDGEPAFRRMETEALHSAARRSNFVICAGGGTVTSPENQALMHKAGIVVLLEARPETILARLKRDLANGGAVRPLLEGPDPLKRITELKQERQRHYATGDWTVHTDELTPGEAAQEVVRGWRYWSRRRCGGRPTGSDGPAAIVTTATQSYPVFVGWDILEDIGARMSARGLHGRAFVVSDETVAALYGERMARFLNDSGFESRSSALAPGEAAKNLGSVSWVYDFLVAQHAERSDTLVAFGGGVVGDTAGFAAATFNRGLCLVQAPTTLVGMVDSSIGGKVGVDHPQGKNLIGAFYQPSLVLSDAQLLTTLPRRELSAGYAEVAKHGLIADAAYFSFIENNADRLMALSQDEVVETVSRSVSIKADVVSRDERETEGLRTLLNYGHTIGHGIEAAAGYGKYLHGEAVAVGMVGAALLSHRLGLVGREVVERQCSLFERLGLPVACAGVRKAEVLKAMKLDKKVKTGSIRWVLLQDVGKAVVRPDVPSHDVEAVLNQLGMG